MTKQIQQVKTKFTSAPPNDGLPRVDKLSQLRIDEDGTVHVPEMAVPVSPYLSPEGKLWLIEHLHQNQSTELQRRVGGNQVFLQQYIDRVRELFLMQKTFKQISRVFLSDTIH